jgi:hypothetical protein
MRADSKPTIRSRVAPGMASSTSATSLSALINLPKTKREGDELRAQEFLTWEHHLTLMRNLSPLLLVLVWVTGCAALPPLPFILPSVSGQVPVLPVTSVSLAERNYRIVKTNVVGTSRGFALLGLITVKPPNYTEAFAQLYQAGGVSAGKALALINVVQQSSAPYFILFSLPKITLRADVVEFVETLPPHEP